ncbi:MAG: hypothetical protein R3B54_13355 [Bdellovibrionota bacterium]
MAALATQLNICGIPVQIRGEWDELRRAIAHDFTAFCTEEGACAEADSLEVELNQASHRRGWTPLLKTQRSTLFISPLDERRVCFFDQVAVRYRYAQRKAQIWSMQTEAAFEALYYVLLSYVGERLDEQGWHRLHGFGFSGKRRAVVLASSGTGKSTLAWSLLQNSGFYFYSDDTPLINRSGEMSAFPQRIALEQLPAGVHGRAFKRARNKTKYVLESESFCDRVGKTGRLQDIYGLIKTTPEEGIAPAPRHQFLVPLLKWLVLGYETPQIWELYLRLSPRDILSKVGILRSRLRAAHRLFWHTKHYIIGRDSEKKTAEWLVAHARG